MRSKNISRFFKTRIGFALCVELIDDFKVFIDRFHKTLGAIKASAVCRIIENRYFSAGGKLLVDSLCTKNAGSYVIRCDIRIDIG